MQRRKSRRLTLAILGIFILYAVALVVLQRRVLALLERFIPALSPTPSLKTLPQTVAPAALSRAVIPDDAAGIGALFERLPAQAAGRPRSPQFDQTGPDRYSAAYGEVQTEGVTLSLHAIDISATRAYPPDWTAGQVIAAWAKSDIDRQIVAAGRDDGLGWVQWQETYLTDSGEERQICVMNWGKDTSPWLFGAQADTPENLQALITAFVEAAWAVRS